MEKLWHAIKTDTTFALLGSYASLPISLKQTDYKKSIKDIFN